MANPYKPQFAEQKENHPSDRKNTEGRKWSFGFVLGAVYPGFPLVSMMGSWCSADFGDNPPTDDWWTTAFTLFFFCAPLLFFFFVGWIAIDLVNRKFYFTSAAIQIAILMSIWATAFFAAVSENEIAMWFWD